MVKPFRFGVQCGGDHDRASWQQLCHKIEALGYSTVYLPDHFIDTQMAPLVGLAVAAEATKTLRVGALVFDNDYKHPAILAKEIATLDRLSDGRTEMGIGAGWMKVDYDALGSAVRPGRGAGRPARRGARGHQGLVGPGPVQLRGHALHDHRLQRHPEADPAAVPADPRRRRRAARCCASPAARPTSWASTRTCAAGEVTNDAASDSVAEMVDQKVGWIREGAGDRFDDLELQIRFFFAAITDDRQALAEAAAPGFGLSAGGGDGSRGSPASARSTRSATSSLPVGSDGV